MFSKFLNWYMLYKIPLDLRDEDILINKII